MAQSCRRASAAIGILLILLGAAVLVGWATDTTLLKCFVPGQIWMKPNAAICFALVGIALFAMQDRSGDLGVVVPASLAITLGALTLAEYVFDTSFGIDQVLFLDRSTGIGSNWPGRMAPSTAMAFVLSGGALLTLLRPSEQSARSAQSAALLVAFVGLVRCMSFVTTGETEMFSFSIIMAVHTAIGVALLGVGVTLAVPERGLMAVVVSEGPGGSAFRRLSVSAMAAPPITLLVALAGIAHHLFDAHYALALALSGLIPATFVAMWRCAREEEEIDARRRRAEERLAASEARFKLLSECSPVGVFLADAAGACTYINPRITQLSGVPAEGSLGQGWRESVHPEDRERVAREWQNAAASGEDYQSEFRLLTPAGDVRWVQSNATPILEERAVAGYVGTIVDLTERRTSEQLRTDLVSMLSHDLKNPLTVIVGFTEHLLDTLTLDDADRGLLQRIEANAKVASTLASNFVDAMRIEAGKLEVRRRRLPLSDTVRSVVDSETVLAKTRGVQIETLETGRVPEMLVDRGLLERALGNLVSNAVKFSPPGGRVQITVGAASGEARITVSDEGPGIQPLDQDRLFQRFGTLPGSKPDSTGLGLFIVKTIAEAHGGSVAFTRPPHGGAAFTIALPLDN